MYEFVDTTQVSGSGVLPSEALRINGEYLENLIPGYRTLNVSGREALSPELSTFTTGIRDGGTLKIRRFPARVITVKYHIIAENNGAFREAYNALAGALNVENAELIFNDEADKYFIGTPSKIKDVDPGLNAVVGEFEILCADPLKYSVEEYEVTTVDTEETDEEGNVVTGKSFILDYNGTYKALPTFETSFYAENEVSEDGETFTPLTGGGDCGFVAFFTEDGKIIQLGDPEEVDGEDFKASQTLANQSFANSKSWGTATQSLWVANAGATLPDGLAQVGTLANAKAHSKAKECEYYLKAKSYGSGNGWHGSSITRTLPADDSGEVGAKNFTLTYAQQMYIGSNNSSGQKQLGTFHAHLVSGSGDARKIVAGVNVCKNTTGKTAKLIFYVNNAAVETMDIDLSLNNIYFGADKAKTSKAAAIVSVKTSTIKKEGDTVTFNIAGIKKSFTEPKIADVMTTEVTFAFGQYAQKAALAYNGLISAKFVKDRCLTWREVPNKFSCGDTVTANCRNGEIKVNDTPAPEYGALGNDWEEFALVPGTNQIGVAYSDWIEDAYAPTFRMRYREVFL